MIPRQILDDQPIRVLLVAPDPAVHASVVHLASQAYQASHIVDWVDSYAAGAEPSPPTSTTSI